MTKRPATQSLTDWFCDGQLDLTDLVEDEHITGSMPAAESERLAAQEAFYQQLRDRNRHA